MFESTVFRPSYLLQTTNDSQHVYLIKKKINSTGDPSNAHYMSPEEGFRRVQRGHFAYHCEATVGYTLIRQMFAPHEICVVKEIPFRKNRYIGVAVKKFSPFRDHLATFWNWMRETGVLKKHTNHWIVSRPACLSNVMLTRVGFDYVGAFFTFLLSSYVISLSILAMEISFYRYRKNRLENQRASLLKIVRCEGKPEMPKFWVMIGNEFACFFPARIKRFYGLF